MAWSGLDRQGLLGVERKGSAWYGKELATVDRWLEIAILRVFGSQGFGWEC